MDVILIENVSNLGTVGDLLKVKDGYARNYLLPNKLAILATPKSMKQFEHQKRVVAQRVAKMKAAASDMKARVEALSCTIARQAGEEDKLFGSVTSRDIADAMTDAGVEIDRRAIQLDAPIKTTGNFEISVKLHQDVVATLKLWVVAKQA
jgi:large subunit ribosomal protein L9